MVYLRRSASSSVIIPDLNPGGLLCVDSISFPMVPWLQMCVQDRLEICNTLVDGIVNITGQKLTIIVNINCRGIGRFGQQCIDDNIPVLFTKLSEPTAGCQARPCLPKTSMNRCLQASCTCHMRPSRMVSVVWVRVVDFKLLDKLLTKYNIVLLLSIIGGTP